MTEAVIQKNEVIDLGENIIQHSFPQNNSDGTFSTLMKNVSNKVEKTKSNFIDKAVKTNTSSINQYVLKNDKTKKTSNIDNTKVNYTKENTQTSNTTEKQPLQTENRKKLTNDNSISKQSNVENAITKKQNSKNIKSNNTETSVLKNQKEVKNSNSDDVKPSKLNNDSLESSPVFLNSDLNDSVNADTAQSAENTTIDVVQKAQKEIKDIAENVLLTFDIPISNNNDNAIDIDSIFDEVIKDNSTDLNTIIKAVDEISSQIDDMDLSKENKDKILFAFEKLKNGIEEINDTIQFEKTVNDTKTLLNNVNLIVKENEDTTNEIQNGNLEKTIPEAETIISRLKEIKNQDNQSKDEIINELDDIISKLKNYAADSKNTSEIINKLSEELNALKNNIKENNLENIDAKLSDVSEAIDNLKDSKIEKNESTQKINELISQLKNIEKSDEYKKLTKEEKEEIKKTIKVLEDFSKKEIKNDNEISTKKVEAEVNEILSKEKIKNESSENLDLNNTAIKSENADFSKDYTNNNKQQNENLKNFKIEFKNEKTSNNEPSFDFLKENSKDKSENLIETIDDVQDETIQEAPDINSKSTTKLSGSLVKEIKADFLEDISYSNETSGALSVADEVMKIALNENNSILSQTNSGTITYDSANSAVTIKNIQNIIQQPIKETQEVNILNQINDKIYQLKDSQKLTLILRPNDLGRLSIELVSNKDGLCANIVAQNEHVRNYIERNVNDLRSQLSQAGVNVNTIQIKTAGENNTSTYDGGQNREFQQQEQQSQQNNQQKQQNKNPEKNQFANMQNYDLRFTKDFSSVLNKTLSYMN